MALSKERKGEIALQILKRMARTKGVKINDGSRQEMTQFASEIGVPASELLEFAREIIEELVQDTFS